jgi:hypothetical protein
MPIDDLNILSPLYPIAFSAEDDAGPFVIAPTFLDALRDRLRTSISLSAITDVYLSEAPPGAEFPFLIIDYPQTEPFLHRNDYWETTTVQFTILSLDVSEAYTLGVAAWSELAPGDGESPLGFADGEEFQRRIPGTKRGPFKQRDPGPNGETVWAYLFYYRFIISRSYRGGT